MSTNLYIEYDASKALTYKLTSGSGEFVRSNLNVLSINLSSPAVLSLGYNTETVITNEQGATTGDNVQPLNTADKASGKADGGLAQTGDVAGIAAVGAVLCAAGVVAFARKRMQH